MLRLPRSRADKEPQLASPGALRSRRSQAGDVFAEGRARPFQAGALKGGGRRQATEALITEAEQGQPCGNCAQLTDGTGGGGATAGGLLATEPPGKVRCFLFHLQKRR